jgi:hypothetical protein
MIENRLIHQNSSETVKKECDQIEARGKQIYFSPATWADLLSNFLLFISFQPNEVIYLKTEIYLDS